MEKKKEVIEIRYFLHPKKQSDIYDAFVKAVKYFKIKENEVAKMLMQKGYELWAKDLIERNEKL